MDNNLLEHLTQKAATQITEGLKEDQADLLIKEFHLLLEIILKTILNVPSDKSPLLAEKAGDELIRSVVGTAAENRLEYVRLEQFKRRLRILDQTSWQMAQRVLRHPEIKVEMRSVALDNLKEAEKMLEILNNNPENWQKIFGRTLSEILVESRYILDLDDQLSIRLGHLLY